MASSLDVAEDLSRRQQTMRGTAAWSYDLLEPATRIPDDWPD